MRRLICLVSIAPAIRDNPGVPGDMAMFAVVKYCESAGFVTDSLQTRPKPMSAMGTTTERAEPDAAGSKEGQAQQHETIETNRQPFD
jgi:hypothetical protein